jgi:hypothetical protein
MLTMKNPSPEGRPSPSGRLLEWLSRLAILDETADEPANRPANDPDCWGVASIAEISRDYSSGQSAQDAQSTRGYP